MISEDRGKTPGYALSCILSALAILICLWGSVGAEPKAERVEPVRFAIYLLEKPDDVNKIDNVPFDKLELADKPLLTQDDIESYDCHRRSSAIPGCIHALGIVPSSSGARVHDERDPRERRLPASGRNSDRPGNNTEGPEKRPAGR